MDTGNDDLQGHPWALVRFGGFKAHFCPSDLLADLIIDLEGRGGPVEKVEGVSKGVIDLPGMIATNRPWEEVQLGDFVLNIPSQDFAHFLAELGSTPVRRFASGKEYHKIHGWLVCVVFTPEQRADALKAMEALLPEAVARADEADRQLDEALARINKDKARVLRPRLTHVPVPPKDRN